jgi:hypothetical protein
VGFPPSSELTIDLEISTTRPSTGGRVDAYSSFLGPLELDVIVLEAERFELIVGHWGIEHQDARQSVCVDPKERRHNVILPLADLRFNDTPLYLGIFQPYV